MTTQELTFTKIISMLNEQSRILGNTGHFFAESKVTEDTDTIRFHVVWGWTHPMIRTKEYIMIRHVYEIPKLEIERATIDIRAIKEGEFWDSIITTFIRYSILGKRSNKIQVGNNTIQPFIPIRDFIEKEYETIKFINENI